MSSLDDYGSAQVYDELDNIHENMCYQKTAVTAVPVKKKMQASYETPPKNNGNPVKTSNRKCSIVLAIIIIILILGVTSACVFFSLEIFHLRSEIEILNQLQQNATSLNVSNWLLRIENSVQILFTSFDTLHNEVCNISNNSQQQLNGTSGLHLLLYRLSNIEDEFQEASNFSEQLSEAILTLVNQYNSLSDELNTLYYLNSVVSCAALSSSARSGYYWVRSSNGSAVQVFCDMNRSCGGITGGWMRVAELDMANNSHRCPSGLAEFNYTNTRTCARHSDSRGCSSVLISTYGLNYTSVCGRVIAFQYSSPDAFHSGFGATDINSNYVDGVSLTHGNPREHIWTFTAALNDLTSNNIVSICPCSVNFQLNYNNIPQFVGNDYFCDTGSPDAYIPGTFYSNPLWDGQGCGPRSSCCTFNNPPWFYKRLPESNDDIELRLCRDEPRENEDIAIGSIDIYVQ